MTDTDDIVERLRAVWAYPQDFEPNVARLAAAEIERLRAELDAATRLLHKQGYNRSEWWTDD